jgi:hypothetical protein
MNLQVTFSFKVKGLKAEEKEREWPLLKHT